MKESNIIFIVGKKKSHNSQSISGAAPLFFIIGAPLLLSNGCQVVTLWGAFNTGYNIALMKKTLEHLNFAEIVEQLE